MTIKVKIMNDSGGSVGELDVEDKYIELEKGEQAVRESVVAYLAGLRNGTACTKTRAEVKGTGAKPWRQKGLGRARSGSYKSPIWRGGGIAFGPKPRSFAKHVNKKVRTLGLKRVFSERLQEGDVIILESVNLPDHKTKNVVKLLDNLKIDRNDSICLVTKEYDENLLRATGNLPLLMLIKASSLNAYQVLRFKKLVFTKDAFDEFVKQFEGGR